jgi:pilus assembly protein CpaF
VASIQLLTEHYWSPIAELLAKPEVNDIFVDRFDRVYYSALGAYHDVPMRWPDEAALRAAVDTLANQVNGTPLGADRYVLDSRFDDGSRVTVNVPPLVQNTTVTIRVARSRPYRLAELDGAMFPPDLGQYLMALAHAPAASVLISGATGSAKTTLLRAIVLERSGLDRFFVIEDTKELRVDLGRSVQHEIPTANKAGHEMTDSIRASLRAAPDRLIVGEIRSPSAVQAMLEGFEAGVPVVMTTIHARSASYALQRAESLLARTGLFSLADSYRQLVLDNVTHVLHCALCPDGVRRLVEVGVVRDRRLWMLWKWDQTVDWLFDEDAYEKYGRLDADPVIEN